MKRTAFLLLVLAAAVCCRKPDIPETNAPDPDPIPPVEEVEVTLSLDKSEINISKGESFQLNATVTPEDTPIRWESSNTKSVMIDRTGKGTGISVGEATVTVYAGDKTASCNVSVTLPPEPDAKVGDFYYTDGTFSSSLDPSKTVVGVVFWTGDPTLEDPTLKKDHPECTNGLVVSLHGEIKGYSWQPEFEAYDSTIGKWIEDNTDFLSITSPFGVDDNVNIIRGYNNTKAIEAFNAAEENAAWPVEVVEKVLEYREEYPTPASCSGWYLPSVKECSLLISGETEGKVFDIDGDISNKSDIDYKISLAGGNSIGRKGYEDDIWSSNERDYIYAFYVSTLTGKVWMNFKQYGSDTHQIRYILAF